MRELRPGGAALLAALLALGVHAHAASNGFAYDDERAIVRNPVVTEGSPREALDAPYWPTRGRESDGLNYRPLTLLSFQLEWKLFGGDPAGFHVVSLLAHAAAAALVTLLVYRLLTLPGAGTGGATGPRTTTGTGREGRAGAPPRPASDDGPRTAGEPTDGRGGEGCVGGGSAAEGSRAGAGADAPGGPARWGSSERVSVRASAFAGALFALHPVHVEAVANVVGRAEIYATLAVVAAVLWYLREPRRRAGRVARLVGVTALFGVGLASKEIAVTLPALLLAAGWVRWGRRALRRDVPLALLLAAIGITWFALRASVVGSLRGDNVAAALLESATGERLGVALSLWPEYVRLMLIPLELSVDYSPEVLPVPATGWRIWTGISILTGAVALGVAAGRRAPLLSLGLLWFGIAVLPVSNLVVAGPFLVAERSLYLPSAGLSILAAAVLVRLDTARGSTPGRRGPALLAATILIILVVMGVRSALRVPAWRSTSTVLATLARDHPESHLARRARAAGLLARGDTAAAMEAYEAALAAVPLHHGTLLEAGWVARRSGRPDRALELFERAIEASPDDPVAYRLLGELGMEEGRPDRARRVALSGLARAPWTRDLWDLISESWVASGDLDAAIRARRAALATPGGGATDRRRLEVLEEAREGAARSPE